MGKIIDRKWGAIESGGTCDLCGSKHTGLANVQSKVRVCLYCLHAIVADLMYPELVPSRTKSLKVRSLVKDHA